MINFFECIRTVFLQCLYNIDIIQFVELHVIFLSNVSALKKFVFRRTCCEGNSYISVPQILNPSGCVFIFMLAVFVIHYVQFLGYLKLHNFSF